MSGGVIHPFGDVTIPAYIVKNQLSFSTLLMGQLLDRDVIGQEDTVTVRNLVEAMPKADKQKNLVSIKSFLALLEQLKAKSPEWNEGITRLLKSDDIDAQRYQRNIVKLQSALAQVNGVITSDDAQISQRSKTGGIDFNPAQMSMHVKKEGEDFKFDFNGTEIDAAQVAAVTFTIRTITPVTNFPSILGLASNSEAAVLSLKKN